MKTKSQEQRLKEKYLREESISVATCPGCGHGILRGLILRVISDLELDEGNNLLMVGGIGCAASYVSTIFKVDTLHTLHGRAIAFATGAKVFNPRLKVMVIGGDGDIGDIGGNHLIHAARRNMDLTVILANNGLYGMTGGQVACSTPFGLKTTTTAQGNPYRPFNFPKLVKVAGASYAARFSITQPFELMEGIKKALQIQGFSFIEVLTTCPTQYGRRNDLGTPPEMFEFLMNRCISKEDARGVKPEELKDMFITGEVDND
jgi:2-oxoglutarate ferredoxin oxidoreductase subunit beta